MLLSTPTRMLIRGMFAGAVVIAGASACSRSDRADAGRDTTQTGAVAAPSDTQAGSATQPATPDTAMAPARDTAAPHTGARSQTVNPSPEPKPARAAAPAQDSAAPNDKGVSGYQAMGHDTAAAPAESTSVSAGPVDSSQAETEVAVPTDHAMSDTTAAAGVTADTVTVGVSADTTTAGYEPMARDTSVELAQGDTANQTQTDTTTAVAAADSTTILAKADTAQAEVDTTQARPEADTVSTPTEPVRPAEDSSEVYGQVTGKTNADSLPESERIRPPADSTEVLGQVTSDQANSDVEAVGDAEAVGGAPVQSTGNIVTGAEAVAQLTREGQSCRVEDSHEGRWDLAGSPATLNPCGTGTMTLPKIQTGEER